MRQGIHLELASLLALVYFSPPLAAISPIAAVDPQEVPPPKAVYRERLQVTEILLQVSVTDAGGNPVLGLQAADFQVEENGRPMEITAVTYQSYLAGAQEPSTPQGISAGDDSARIATFEIEKQRYFILLFHDLIFLSDRSTLGLMSQRMRAGRGIRRWVREELGEQDRVAVAVYGSRLRLLLDFTGDKERILNSVNTVLARRTSEDVPMSPGAGPSLSRHLPQGNALRDATTNIKKALKVLAQACGHIEGRKHLLFLTIGVDIAGSERGLFNSRFTPGFAEVLNNHEVIVYPIDLTPPGVEHGLVWNLVDLAEDTGGRYIAHVEEFHKPLRSISRSLAGYYEVSYRTSIPLEASGYRSIEVRTSERSHQISARRGYFFGLEQ